MSADKKIDAKVQQQVADARGLYVYMLVDPETGIPFYVGKGRGERFAVHGFEAMLTKDEKDVPGAKIQKIREIRERGQEPEIWIIRHGMNSVSEYTSVEAACIDLLRSMPVVPITRGDSRIPEGSADQLTNARREASKGHGIMLLNDLYHEMAAPLLTTQTPLLIVNLGDWIDDPQETPDGSMVPGYGYKKEWLTSSERVKHFYDIGMSAAKWFRYTESRVEALGIEHVVAAYRGVTRALVKIIPGTWAHIDSGTYRRSGFQFEVVTEGDLFDETIGEYGYRLPEKKRGEQAAYRYWPYA